MAPRLEKNRVSPRTGGNAKQPSAPVPPAHTEQGGPPAENTHAPVTIPAEPTDAVVTHAPVEDRGESSQDQGMGSGSALTSLTEIENTLDGFEDEANATSRVDKGKGRALAHDSDSSGTQIMDPRLIHMLDDLQLHVAAHDSQLETASLVAEQARQSVQAATVARSQINSIISAIVHQYGPRERAIKQEDEEIDLSQFPPAPAVNIVVTPPSIPDASSAGIYTPASPPDTASSSLPAGHGARTPEEGRRNLEAHRARMADMIQKTSPAGRAEARTPREDSAPRHTERTRVQEHLTHFGRDVDAMNERHVRIAEPYTSVSPYSVMSAKPRVQPMPAQAVPKSGALGVLDPAERIREMVLSRVNEAVSAGFQIKGLKFTMPESYDGKDDLITFEVWLGALLRWLRLSQAVGPQYDSLRLDALGQCLTDRAAKWYNDEIESPSRSQVDWTFLDAILALFRRFVVGKSDQTALERFMATRFSRKGGVAEFYNELRTRSTRLVELPNDYTFRRLFVSGLPADILEIMYKHKGVVAEEGTTTELLAAALEAESGTRAYRQMLESLGRPRVTSATALPSISPTSNKASRTSDPDIRPTRSAARSPRPTANDAPRPSTGRNDAYRGRNRSDRNEQRTGRDRSEARPKKDKQSVICFACGGAGHYHYAGDAECPKTGQTRVYAARVIEGDDDSPEAPPGVHETTQPENVEATGDQSSEDTDNGPLGAQYESAEEFAEDYEASDSDVDDEDIGPPMRLATMRIAAMRLRPLDNGAGDDGDAIDPIAAPPSAPIAIHTNGAAGSHSPAGTTPEDGWPSGEPAEPTRTIWGEGSPAWGNPGAEVTWGD
ncbi:hypothetical protein FA95DRAFT_1613981 [Auriscalpium vulgare]|uniref:Uncharacterized protein n=1 Tax=Auriscalpium vulgare TaxID=40419 RepID=A0ACB8R194_9AGAM|nr:hypothetical protein FA95DRAFT_1613981 [Auriscalpium vulgare]